ncbi:MAG: site-2 protease family protein [Pirellulales bacterium]
MTRTTLESRWPSDFLHGEPNEPPDVPKANGSHRRKRLLLWLFVFTFLSTAWVGTTAWSPTIVMLTAWSDGSLHVMRCLILENGWAAILFAVSLLAILTAHELGHYFMTRYYGIPATPPIFIPFPFHPIGTCGALIAMEGGNADRKQMFDIGIAGPLAGLVVAIPILFAGFYTNIEPSYSPQESFRLGQPLLIQLLADWLQLSSFQSGEALVNTRLNPFIMAAWAGLLVTGLNMMPMSQLDGGHVTFGLLGKHAIYVAYAAFASCIAFMVVYQQYSFALMLGLVLLIGLRHPPSRNDDVTLGWFRHVLGWASLSLPILCIPIEPFAFLF